MRQMILPLGLLFLNACSTPADGDAAVVDAPNTDVTAATDVSGATDATSGPSPVGTWVTHSTCVDLSGPSTPDATVMCDVTLTITDTEFTMHSVEAYTAAASPQSRGCVVTLETGPVPSSIQSNADGTFSIHSTGGSYPFHTAVAGCADATQNRAEDSTQTPSAGAEVFAGTATATQLTWHPYTQAMSSDPVFDRQ